MSLACQRVTLCRELVEQARPLLSLRPITHSFVCLLTLDRLLYI